MPDVLGSIAEGLCKRYLQPYLDKVVGGARPAGGNKQVHDPIWGTISLRPLEVAILDSPLLQRLRHLRQLGVAHWVYPGAGHSRFEHTLGVLFQTQQLIGAINKAGQAQYGAEVIDLEDERMLRMAAILHDVGHPVLSHVSEYALRMSPEMLLEVTREKKNVGEKVSISELIASKVARSDTMKQLIEAVGRRDVKARIDNPDAFCERIAKTILGQNVSKTIPLLHELISGPYDADKLDYMVRDPWAAGIPSIIDISRLVQKLTVQRIETTGLPPEIGKLVPNDVRQAYVFGFPWSGMSVIDELLLARIILYAKLYRHPKVAALEAMAQSLIDQVAALVTPANVVAFVYRLLDDQLVLADRTDLMRWLNLDEASVAEPERTRALDVAVELIRRLRDRELFVRAFAFLPGSSEQDGGSSAVFDKLLKLIDNGEQADRFCAEVVDESRAIMRLLGEDQSGFSYVNADKLITLRKLKPPSQKELRHAWIFSTGGTPQTVGSRGIHKEAWSSSFTSAAAKGYIFAPRELGEFALLATEAVLAKRYAAAVPDWMLEETKQSAVTSRPTKMRLRTKGYYKGKLALIRPKSDRMMMMDVANAANAFGDRFSSLQEAVTDEGKGQDQGSAAVASRATKWLDQFDDEDHVECAMALLARARLLVRADYVAAMRSFLAANPEFKNASVISLGNGNDSSQIVQYYTADIAGTKSYGSLRELVEGGRNEPVIIVDDFTGSGGQMSHILASMFDMVELKREDLNEQRSLALKPEQDFLRERKIAFVFTAAWEAGRKAVAEMAAKVGLDAKVFVYLSEDQLPEAAKVLEESGLGEKAKSFLNRLEQIGAELLRSNEPDWSPDKVSKRALGYGNRGLLLFFPYNVPSQTVTCMWADGSVEGNTWTPIMRRRKKVT